MSYRKVERTALLKFDQLSKPIIQVTLPDSLIFKMVDDGIEEVEIIFKDGRYFSYVDDWLERVSEGTTRQMPLTMMDRR